jgi:hypothetical protein
MLLSISLYLHLIIGIIIFRRTLVIAMVVAVYAWLYVLRHLWRVALKWLCFFGNVPTAPKALLYCLPRRHLAYCTLPACPI